MTRGKQAGHLCYDAEDFDSLEFEHDNEDRSSYIDAVREMANGDFAHLVEVLKKMEPGLSGTEAITKARKMAPGTFAKLRGESSRVSLGAREEAMEALARNEFQSLVAHFAKSDGCSRVDAMRKARLEAPDAYSVYNGTKVPVTKSVASKDKENWELEVEGEKMRNNCSHVEVRAASQLAAPIFGLAKALPLGRPRPLFLHRSDEQGPARIPA